MSKPRKKLGLPAEQVLSRITGDDSELRGTMASFAKAVEVEAGELAQAEDALEQAELVEIPDFPGYAVSRDGRLWSRHRRGRRLGGNTGLYEEFRPRGTPSNGVAILFKDGAPSSRSLAALVYDAFGPGDRGDRYVYRIDQDNGNNAFDNLTLKHIHHGRTRHKIIGAVAEDIARAVESGESIASIAERHGVTRQSIYNYVNQEFPG